MKKYLSIIALATLAIVGCSKVNLDQSAKNEEDTPISFKALNYVSQTKADHEHIALPKDAQFDILAYFADDSITKPATTKFFFFKDTVWNTATTSDTPSSWKWETKSNTYYWPKTGMLSFYAVYPAGKAGFDPANPNDGFSFKDYAVTVKYAEQAEEGVKEDLMLAQTLDQNCNNVADIHYTDGVALLFKHELAKVKFAGKLYDKKFLTEDSTKVQVNDVYFTATIDEIAIDSIKYKGTLALASGEYKWTPTADYGASEEIVANEYNPALNAVIEQTKVLNPKDWTKFEEEYYVLPQKFDNHAKVTVKFTVYAYDKNGKVISKTAYDKDALPTDKGHNLKYTKYLKGFTTGEGADTLDEWKINTVYNYRFIIDPFEGAIYFDPCVADWDQVDVNPEIIYENSDHGEE